MSKNKEQTQEIKSRLRSSPADDQSGDRAEQEVLAILQQEWNSYDEKHQAVPLPEEQFAAFVRRAQARNKNRLIKEFSLFLLIAVVILSLSYMISTQGFTYFIGIQLVGVAFLPVALFLHYRKRRRTG